MARTSWRLWPFGAANALRGDKPNTGFTTKRGGDIDQRVERETINTSFKQIAYARLRKFKLRGGFGLLPAVRFDNSDKFVHQIVSCGKVRRFLRSIRERVPYAVKNLLFHLFSFRYLVIAFSRRLYIAFVRSLAFLLESVKDVNRLLKTRRVDNAIRAAFVSNANFANAFSDSLHRLPIGRLAPALNSFQLPPRAEFRAFGEGSKTFEAIAYEYDAFHLANYIETDIKSKVGFGEGADG